MTPDEWLALPNDHVGLSSMTIWSALTGRPMPASWEPDIPIDVPDFRRCHFLVHTVPGWRERLGEVAERYPVWRRFVEAWPELERLFDDYDDERLAARINEVVEATRGQRR
jgi:hypothetical protein